MKRFLLMTPLLWGLYACSGPSGPIRQSFADSCWPQADTLATTWTPGTTGDHTLQVYATYQPDYRFQNIHFRVELIPPTGPARVFIVADTLMDARGVWEEEGFQSTSAPIRFDVAENGLHTLRLSHYMRTDDLCEIRGVTLLKPVPVQ
ncbi:MAG: hypothetical protein AAFV07_07115 [Bacteroidota bacterium]